jgi:hypothetical protein
LGAGFAALALGFGIGFLAFLTITVPLTNFQDAV